MNSGWVLAPMGAAVGSVAVPWLTRRALVRLNGTVRISARLRLSAAFAGSVAGAMAVLASEQTRFRWALPALLVWAYVLVAAACCDALTQRVPTPLVRQAIACTAVLLTVGSIAVGDYRRLAVAGLAAAAAGGVLTLCWRFAGAGFGDVRIAVLGGLGLLHPKESGLLIAVATFSLITVSQALVALARGGNRNTTIPYGPALASAFLVAAAIP